jgi:hypothetical protein
MKVVLAATHHDPAGRLYEQTMRALPALAGVFDGLAIQATHTTWKDSLDLLAATGALIRREDQEHVAPYLQLGRARRGALELALQLDAPFILFCDFDRALHWAERYPQELAQVAARLPEHDFTVLGRTDRAFRSHPRIQRDTEAIVNRVYATVSGQAWDVTAAARGLSRRAAETILEGCLDESIGTDVAWPLFLQREARFTLGYIAAEGLEFETADRYGDAIAACGGIAQWLAQLDADPRQWIQRLELARVEVAALLPYIDQRPTTNDQRRAD